jgi:uncharacterized protein YdhG (YjbR/CyaY superfamily)
MKRPAGRSTRSAGAAKDVDAYLVGLPIKTRAVLERLRRAIRAAAPKAEERISYRIPSYKYHGWLVFFAAFKKHNSFIVPGESAWKEFRRELEPFQVSGKTIHFTAEHPLSAALVRKIVKTRIKENESDETKG